MNDDLHRLFLPEIRRRLTGEGQERILKCLDLLTEEDIWYRPNAQSNSVGNLVLHLCGNVTQWLFSTMGGEEDTRKRQSEFDEKGPVSRENLKQKIIDLMLQADQIIKDLDSNELTKIYSVQGFQESGLAILIHITEHFSYHVGQITYFVKARRDIDVGYYAGKDLDQINKA
ncbi:MAG: DUF1572 family protein [Saprospiraceae bacterium]|nr:DUF1572 family protein [Saprospiraceae bacterium]